MSGRSWNGAGRALGLALAAAAPGIALAAQPSGEAVAVIQAASDKDAKGDRLLIMEALKMELPIVAPVGGTLTTLHVSAGQTVEAGDPLAVIVS
jgi:oxaloacetate decarboxylase alpha subunit